MSHGILNGMRCLSLLSALTFLAGCGTQHEASVEVIVPVAVQEQYNRDTPGELILEVETDGNFAQQLVLGILCDPLDEARTAVWMLTGSGCATQATLTAWVQDADPDSTCDGGPANTLTVGAEPDEGAWDATAVLFEGNTRGCLDGDETLRLTLSPPDE
jgi:hypothetical protein